jgi:hypothetical protein
MSAGIDPDDDGVERARGIVAARSGARLQFIGGCSKKSGLSIEFRLQEPAVASGRLYFFRHGSRLIRA